MDDLTSKLADIIKYNNRERNTALAIYSLHNDKPFDLEDRKAIELYRRSVDLNDLKAINNLADYYRCGYGIEPNMSKAVKLYKRAVDLNDSKARRKLAFCYRDGMGIKKSISKAIDLFYKGGRKNTGDEICNKCDIINKYNKKKQINDNLIEEYMLLITKLDYENNNDNLQLLDDPTDTEEYFYGWLELKKINKELKEINNHMKTEVEYRPGGSGYEEAKEEFESFI